MRKYNITVNGKAFEVEVQEIGGSPAPVYAASAPASVAVATAPTAAPMQAPAAAPAVAAAPKAATAAPAAPSAGASVINAPIPGKILDIKVSVGDAIKKDQLLLILEAMKMENEIFSPNEGIVESIPVSNGDSVNAGDLLVSIK